LPVPAGQRPGVRPPGQRRLAAAVAALADTRGAAMSFPVWNLASVMSAIPAQMKVLLGASLAVMLLGGCEKAMQNMYDQPKYKPMAESDLFEDGTSARPLPPGTVPHASGPFAGTSSGRVGAEVVEQTQAALSANRIPYPVNLQLL